METLPNWLEAAVAAAGMTTYAADWDRSMDVAAPPMGEIGVQALAPGAVH